MRKSADQNHAYGPIITMIALSGLLWLGCLGQQDPQIVSSEAGLHHACSDAQVQRAIDETKAAISSDTPLDSLCALWGKHKHNGCFAIDTLLASAAHKLGSLNQADNHILALKCFHLALEIRSKVYALDDTVHFDIQRLYFNIGILHSMQLELDSALYYYGLIPKSTPINLPYFLKTYETGNTYLLKGELTTAGVYIREAESYLQNNPDINVKIRDKTPSLMVVCSDYYRQINQYNTSIEKGKMGLAYLSQPDKNNQNNYATLCINIGNAWQDSFSMVERKNGHITSALRDSAIWYTLQSLRVFESTNSIVSFAECSRNLGGLYYRCSLYPQAIDCLSEAIRKLQTDSSNRTLQAELYINRGDVQQQIKQYKQALADYDSASFLLLPAYRKGVNAPFDYSQEPIAHLGDFFNLLDSRALTHLAQFKANPSDKTPLYQADSIYTALTGLADRMRLEYLTDDSKQNLSAALQDKLAKAFEVCLLLKQHDPEHADKYLNRAFSIAENSKSAMLLESVRQKSAFDQLSPEWKARNAYLKDRQVKIEDDMFLKRNNPGAMSALQQAWRENFEDQRQFRDSLEQQNAQFFNARNFHSDIAADAIQKNLLGKDRFLLEYYTFQNEVYIFVVTPDTLVMRSAPLQADFSKQLNLLNSKQETTETMRAAHSVYNQLLGPVDDLLPEGARLIIIPDAPFHNLPFETLLWQYDGGNAQQQLENKRYALFRYTISYCYSANLLMEMTKKVLPPKTKHELAAFAPDFAQEQVSPCDPTLPSSLCAVLPSLTPLSNADELNKIAQKVRIKRYEGAEANKTNFLGSCNTRSLAHVASHCVLNDDDPNFNFIAFAGFKPGSQEQGLLFLNDLYAQPLNLDFLGFSACETSKGQFVSGEGNMSMARGLTSAGVKSFVTTLWPVYSDNNATIFPRFYKDLKAGVPKDVALAEAKRAFALGYGRSPFDWGGLVLIGDAGAITLQDYRSGDPFPWWFVAGLMAISACTFWFFRSRKRVI